MVKTYSEAQIDALIKLKYGDLVTQKPKIAYLSDNILGKLFKCSAGKIR